MQKLDLLTARDVLFFFPRTYQDMTDLRDVPQLEEDKLQSVCGVVEDMELRGSQPGKCVLGVLIRSGAGHLRGLWFNMPFMEEKFKVGQRVVFAGKPKLQGLVWQMSHPKVDWLGDEDDGAARANPAGLSAHRGRAAMADAEDRRRDGRRLGNLLEEIFPTSIFKSHNLWPLHRGDRADPRPRQFRATGRCAAALGLPGAFPAGACPGRQSGISSTSCGRPRRLRPRPRSTRESAASSLSS